MTLNTASRPWYKERWPWILMAGPGLVIVAGIVTVWLAIVSNDGLVTDDYYKQGLAVNQQLQRQQQASSLGLTADVMRSGLGVRVLISSKDSVALPDVLTLKLVHPTRAGQDQLIKLMREGQGFYGGRLAVEVEGRWLASIEDPAAQWRLQGEWLVDKEGPLRLSATMER